MPGLRHSWRIALTTLLLAGSALAQKPDSRLPRGGMARGGGGIMYHAPQWSPDGQWLVVSANMDGDTEIYLVRPDGNALRQLTRNNVPDDMARWPPDGSDIAYMHDRDDGGSDIWIMNRDGSGARCLTCRTPFR